MDDRDPFDFDVLDYGLLFLPWTAFSHVEGLEGLSDEESIPWREIGGLSHLSLKFSGDEGRALVELAFERATVVEFDEREQPAPPPMLRTTTIQGLALSFPSLRALSIGGCFGTSNVSGNDASLVLLRTPQS